MSVKLDLSIGSGCPDGNSPSGTVLTGQTPKGKGWPSEATPLAEVSNGASTTPTVLGPPE